MEKKFRYTQNFTENKQEIRKVLNFKIARFYGMFF